jgi:hypothetical protein
MCRAALAARTKAERALVELPADAAPDSAEKKAATAAFAAAKKRFGALHGMSMLMNFVAVGALTWHVCAIAPTGFAKAK